MLTLDANNRAMLSRTLESIAEVDSMIQSYLAQDDAIAEREKVPIQQLEETERQRKTIKDAIASFQTSKQALKLAVGSLRGFFSPIRRLPVEILSHIFYILLLAEQNRRRRMMMKWKSIKTPCTPLVLGRVCSQWRTIVNQTSRLWEDIRLQPDSFPGEDKAQQSINRISQYKTLGIQANQSIFIETWYGRGPEVLLSLLGSNKTPWKSIEIAVCGDVSSQWDIEVIRATHVKLFRVPQKRALKKLEPLLRHATSLFITGMPPVWGSDPWTSLISLEIRPWVSSGGESEGVLSFLFQPSQLIELLSSAPNLEELVLAFPTANNRVHMHNAGGESLAHGSIKSLSIHLHHLETNLRLFGVHVAGPSLRNLAILSFDDYCDCHPASDILSVGWDQLTSLSLGTIADISQVLRVTRLLLRIPTIETLEVQGSNVDRLFILMFPLPHEIPHQTALFSLPRLTKLVMHETDIQRSTLIRFLSVRLGWSEGDTHFRAVTDIDLFENPGILPQDWNDIKILLEIGRSYNSSRVGRAM